MLRKSKVRTKILMLVGLLGIVAIFVCVSGILGMKDAKDGLKTVYNDRVVPLKQLKIISEMYAVTVVGASNKVRNGNLGWSEGLKDIDEAEHRIQDTWKTYRAIDLPGEERRLAGEAEPLLQKAGSSIAKLRGILQRHDKKALDEFVTNELYPVVDPISVKFGKFIEVQCDAAKAEYNRVSAIYRRDFLMFIATIILGLLSACIFTVYIINVIMSQLGGEPHEIADIAGRISEGDLSMQFGSGRQYTGAYAAMRNMTEKLKDVVRDVRSSSDNLASASRELSARAEQMSLGLTEQAGRSSQISTSAAQMSQTVVDVAKNSSSIALSATDTLAAADNGQKIVSKSVEEVKAIAETVNDSAKLVSSLGERSKQIGEIVKVIKDIADQTNLLALNAAIEAARAGEQGRGFAIVADEVRKLAERTAKATSEIGDLIATIQEEMTEAILSMERGTERVEIGVEFSVQAGDALKSMVGSVTDLQSMVQKIAIATEEMSAASEQISGDIITIADVSKETSASSDQVSRASSDLATLAGNLQSVVGMFKM